MNPRLVGLSLAVVLVMAAASVGLASGGSAYVTSSCEYPSLQDNSIDNDNVTYVWVKETGDGFGTLTWTAFNNPSGATDGDGLTATGCTRDGGKYVLYSVDGYPTSPLGSWTLTVWDGSDSVSSDSYRLRD